MKWNRLWFLAAAFSLSMMGLVQGQNSDQTLLFKGALPEEPNGKVALIFKMYDQTDGTKLLEETNTVDVSGGLFTTYIGNKTPGGALQGVPANASLWVEFAKVSAPDQVVGNGKLPLKPAGAISGACVLCYRCGGDYPYYGGTHMQGNYRELDDQCRGDFTERNDNPYLCCSS